MVPKTQETIQSNIKFTVVTVCYNASAELESTIESVLSQDYPNLEYIIIDGGSKDGSVEIIKKYANRLAYWVSEPDKGIYDAMNKGIAAATGDYINFMNAGDKFASPKILSKITQEVNNADVIYGNWGFISSDKYITKRAGSPSELWKGGQLNHQSVIMRIDKSKILYNTTYRIAADYDLFCRMYALYKWTFRYIPITICIFDPNGISCNNPQKALREVSHISAQYFKGYTYWIKRNLLFCNKSIKNLLKKYLPIRLLDLFRQIRNY